MNLTQINFNGDSLSKEAKSKIVEVFGSIEALSEAFNNLCDTDSRVAFEKIIRENVEADELLKGVDVMVVEEGKLLSHDKFRKLEWTFPFPAVVLDNNGKPIIVFIYEQILMADIRDEGVFESLRNLVAHEVTHYSDLVAGYLQYRGQIIEYMHVEYDHSVYIDTLQDFVNNPYDVSKAKLFLDANPWERKAYAVQLSGTTEESQYTKVIRQALYGEI